MTILADSPGSGCPNSEKWESPSGRVIVLDLDQPEAAVVVLRDELIHAGYTLIEPAPDVTPLDWFEYIHEDGIDRYVLRSELHGGEHWVSFDTTDPAYGVRILLAGDPQDGTFTVSEAATYVDELNRCIAAAKHLTARQAVAA